jgi:hypothetical protein
MKYLQVHWIITTISNLPTFDGMNPLETFLSDFEESVPMEQRLLAMDEASERNPNKMMGDTQKQHYKLGTMLYLDCKRKSLVNL